MVTPAVTLVVVRMRAVTGCEAGSWQGGQRGRAVTAVTAVGPGCSVQRRRVVLDMPELLRAINNRGSDKQ